MADTRAKITKITFSRNLTDLINAKILLDKLKELFENISDIAGEMECSLGEIMAQQSRGFTRPLKGKTGTIRFDSL
jgi:hypothetical protein